MYNLLIIVLVMLSIIYLLPIKRENYSNCKFFLDPYSIYLRDLTVNKQRWWNKIHQKKFFYHWY